MMEKETKSLVDWSNPPTVTDLKNDVTSAQSSHSAQVTKVEDWIKNRDGIIDTSKFGKGRSKIQPKLIRKQAEWRYASLSEPFLSAKDMFDISPRTYEDAQGAQDNALLLNYQMNCKLNKVAFIDEYVRTAVDEGTVIVQVGWDFQEAEKEVEVDIEATPEQFMMYLTKQVRNGQMTQEEAMTRFQSGEPLVVGTKMEKRTVTIKNQPTLRICEYDKLIIDPTCEGDLEHAQFIVSPFETSYSELLKDGTYSNLDKIFGKKGDDTTINDGSDEEFIAASDEEESGFEFKDKARRKLTAYEYLGYWDIEGNGMTTAIRAVWVSNTMIKLEELPYPDGKLSFVAVSYLPVRKSVYGEPDGSLLEDNQALIGATMRGMVDIMARAANGQVGMSKGMLDSANLKKYENGEHFYYNQGHDPRTSIHMQTYPEIPRSAEAMINMQNIDAESMTGVKTFSGSGISGSALGSTATGVRGALDSASKRELGILRRLSKGIEQIGRKIVAMNAVFLSDEEVIRVTNSEFRVINKDDLAGEYDLRLSISTAESDNQKAEELAFMLQTTAQSSDPAEVRMIRAEIARLRKMPELAEKIESFEPTPDPLAQQEAQLRIALLQAQVQNETAKAQENAVDVELKKAKTANELAKAGKTSSEKDQLDLDFVDKESGQSHARDMEKKDHDRLSKLDMEAFKVMNPTKPMTGGLGNGV
jgi:hypothetical protein